MDLVERLPNIRAKGGYFYRVRRFECPICGYQTTIHADGMLDLRIDQEQAQKEIDKKFNQEQKNRKS